MLEFDNEQHNYDDHNYNDHNYNGHNNDNVSISYSCHCEFFNDDGESFDSVSSLSYR
jgi:hypothetical protein